MRMTATEFKAKCLRLLDEVQTTGEELEISKHGRLVAKVVPITEQAAWKNLRGCGTLKGDPFAPVISSAEIDALQ